MNQQTKEYSALQTEDIAHETAGTSICSAWKVAPGTVWVQSRSAQLTKKLKQVTGYREVAYSVMGGYMRTFEFRKSLSWARSWIDRNATANEAFLDLESPQTAPVRRNGSSRGSKRPNAHKPNGAAIMRLEQPEEWRIAA